MPWFAEALRLEGDPARAAAHRLRIACALQQCPRLTQLWHQDGEISQAQFSLDGRRVVTAASSGSARVWDVATGEPVTPELRHDAGVNDAEFSPDGRLVVTASDDGTAQLWNARTGVRVGPRLRHRDRVSWARFSPDGRRVVTASADHTARLWDTTGRPVGRPLSHADAVNQARFSPDSLRVVTASEDGTARIWNAVTGEPSGPVLRQGAGVLDAVFSPDGRRVALGGKAGGSVVEIRAVDTGLMLAHCSGHTSWIFRLAFSRDGRRIASASGDRTARVWDAATGQPVGIPLQHHGTVFDVAFSPDGRRVVTAGHDGAARVWDTETGSGVAPPLRQTGLLHCASFDPRGRSILTGGQDQTARIWDLVTPAQSTRVLRPGAWVPCASFSGEGRRVLVGSGRDRTCVWDAGSGRPVGSNVRTNGWIRAGALSPDGRRLATACYDGTARVWSAESGKPLSPALRHRARVNCVVFSHDGHRLLTGSGEHKGRKGEARLWDAVTGRPLLPPLKHSGAVTCVAFSADDRTVVTAGEDGQARVWDAASGRQRLALPIGGDRRWGAFAAFSADGRRLLTVGRVAPCRVWNAVTGTLTAEMKVPLEQRIPRHESGRQGTRSEHLPPALDAEPAQVAAMSPDGRRVAVCGVTSAGIFDAATGAAITPPLVHGGLLEEVAFSPDGRYVLTASRDDTARLWDATTGEPVTPPLRHEAWVRHVAFSPDARRFLTISLLGAVRVWDLPAGGQPAADLEHLAELLSGQAIDLRGGAVSLPVEALVDTWQRVRTKCPESFRRLPVEVAWSDRREEADRLFDLGQRQREAGKWQEAVHSYTRSLRQLPDGSLGWSNRALAWTCRGDARQHLGLLAEARGDRAEAGRQMAAALADHQEAIRLDPGEFWAWLGRGHTYRELRQWERAILAYTQAIRICEASLDPAAVPWAWARRGQAYAEIGQWERAAADIERRIALRPDDPEWYWRLAVVRLAEHDQAGYRKACERLLTRFLAQEDAAHWIGWTASLAPGGLPDPGRMLPPVEAAAAQHPGDGELLLTLGAALYRAGEWQRSAAALTHALAEANRNFPSEYAYFLLAMDEARMGRTEEARRDLGEGERLASAALAAQPPPVFTHRVTLELLRREARALLPHD